MSDDFYTATAREQIANETAARAEQAITDRATQLRLADERQQQLAAIRTKHGLPDTASLREMADAEISYDRSWRSFVGCRFPNSGTCAEILSPEIVDEARRPAVLARRDKLRTEFEQEYARQVAARPAIAPNTIDNLTQSAAHATGIAA